MESIDIKVVLLERSDLIESEINKPISEINANSFDFSKNFKDICMASIALFRDNPTSSTAKIIKNKFAEKLVN